MPSDSQNSDEKKAGLGWQPLVLIVVSIVLMVAWGVISARLRERRMAEFRQDMDALWEFQDQKKGVILVARLAEMPSEIAVEVVEFQTAEKRIGRATLVNGEVRGIRNGTGEEVIRLEPGCVVGVEVAFCKASGFDSLVEAWPNPDS